MQTLTKFIITIFLCLCVMNVSADTIVVIQPVSGATDYTQDANCMGAWYMNGGLSANGDNETDRSGEGETLTESDGDIPNSATVPTGYSGTSRDFENGDDERLEHADGGSTDISGADQALSICIWVKWETDAGADAPIVSKYKASTNDRQYLLFDDTSESVIVFRLSSDGSATTDCISATDVAGNAGTWYHICGVSNDIDIRLYINGALDSNGADNPKAYTDGIADKADDFDVCKIPFDGLADELIIFDRALSAAEVLEIYTYGISGNKGGND